MHMYAEMYRSSWKRFGVTASSEIPALWCWKWMSRSSSIWLNFDHLISIASCTFLHKDNCFKFAWLWNNCIVSEIPTLCYACMMTNRRARSTLLSILNRIVVCRRRTLRQSVSWTTGWSRPNEIELQLRHILQLISTGTSSVLISRRSETSRDVR